MRHQSYIKSEKDSLYTILVLALRASSVRMHVRNLGQQKDMLSFSLWLIPILNLQIQHATRVTTITMKGKKGYLPFHSCYGVVLYISIPL